MAGSTAGAPLTRTLLFTDVVGSTQRDAELGDSTAAQLRRAHFAMLRAAITTAGGHEVKRLGDGVMAVFPSVAAAVRCAVRVQQSVVEHNRVHLDRLGVRIGIAHGDVRREDGDYFGPPVVEAARLCATAVGGQVLTSRLVSELVADEAAFRTVGRLALKGLPEPVDAVEVCWERSVRVPARGGAPAPGPALPQLLSRSRRLPLVGRTHEAAVLDEARHLASQGQRQVVVLAGPAGIGKTRLCQESVSSWHAEDALALYGRCEEDLVTPYQPFVEALEFYLSHGGVGRHPERRLAELGRIVPAVAELCPDIAAPPALDPDGERYRTFRAVRDLLAEAAGDRLVVLVLDDLHWADRATLLLLRHLVGNLPGARLLVLATYRNTDVGADHPLVATLAALRREPGVDRLVLDGLETAEVAALLEAGAGHRLDRFGLDLAAELRRETGGNPFFVGEVLRHLMETGSIVRSPHGRWSAAVPLRELGIPDSVREVIGHRVGRLGPAARKALSTAAVLGDEFGLADLAELTGTPATELLDLLDQAVAAALVVELGAGTGRFEFTHALTQQTLYDDLGATRRALLHRQVAAYLHRRADAPQRVAELARHWLASRAPEAGEEALRYIRLAGDAALAGVAPDEARRWYQRYLALAGPDGDPLARCEVAIGLGEAQRRTGDPAFRQTLIDAGRAAQQLGAPDLLCRAALSNSRGWASITGEVDTERVALLEAALDTVADGAVRARLLATLSLELVFSGDLDRRKWLAFEAIDLARASGDPSTLLFALQRTHMAIQVPELLPERIRLSAEAVRLADTAGDPVAGTLATGDQLIDAMESGDLGTADRCLARLRRRAEQLGEPVLRWNHAFSSAWRVLLSGDAAAAEDACVAALEMGLDMGQSDALTIYGAQLCAIRWHQGELGDLVPLISSSVSENPGLPGLRSLLALAHAQAGDHESLLALLEAEHERGFALPCDVAWLSGSVLWGEVAAGAGHLPSAGLLHDRLRPWSDRVAFTGVSCEGAVAQVLGRLCLALGRLDEAERHLDTAQSLHERLDAPFHRARTELARAELADRRGDRVAAQHAARTARDLAARHGCAALALAAVPVLA